MLRHDPARPRITAYDDTGSATHGERVELSAKVLANWVSKAANLLQDEWDLGPGSVVRIDLPAHWRSAYWALAVWAVGATVRLGEGAADALVTTSPAAAAAFAADGGDAALVSLAALARRADEPVDGVLDEAAELATHPDAFTAWQEPGDDDVAIIVEGVGTRYADVVDDARREASTGWHGAGGAASHGAGGTAARGTGGGPAGTPDRARVHVLDPSLAAFLGACLAAWAADGSIVLTRGQLSGSARTEREHAERVTHS